jgi:hypothetical protein
VNTITSTSLAEMTIRMLERTAMVLAEPVPDGEEHPQPTRAARITYRGPSEGVLFLCATDLFLSELAASLLGVDTSEINVETHGSDALREMANIVGGSVILAMSGEICEYSLGLPELVPVALAQQGGVRSPGSHCAECTVASEGGVLRAVWIQSPVAELV